MISSRFYYDTAYSLSQGGRDYQEDSLLSSFGGGAPQGFAVVSDGMGGQAAGDIASQLITYELGFALETRMRLGPFAETDLAPALHDLTLDVNDMIADNTRENPEREGMGATLLAPILFEDRMYWVSVGDSPLYLFRNGQLTQINQDHSMAPIIDKMVEDGELDAETAQNHPDRNALRSVLMGSKLKFTDIPKSPTRLQQGDIVIAASDGLQFLSDAVIEASVQHAAPATSQYICRSLMEELAQLDDPAQDNIAILVLQLDFGLKTDQPARPTATTRDKPALATGPDVRSPPNEIAPAKLAAQNDAGLQEGPSTRTAPMQPRNTPKIVLGLGVILAAAAAAFLLRAPQDMDMSGGQMLEDGVGQAAQVELQTTLELED